MPVMSTDEKTCAKCNLPKPRDVEHFRPARMSKDGLHSWCRACCKAYDEERGKKRRKSAKLGRPPKQIVNGKLTCPTCQQPKEATNEFFARDSATPTDFRARCKLCDAKAATVYHEKNRDKRIANAHAWNEANRDRVREIKAASDKECRTRINDYFKTKRTVDIQFRLGMQLRVRLANAVRAQLTGRAGARRGASAVRDLGCTLTEFVQHLEQQFTLGMSWDNYGDWHVDHKKPLISFDLTDAEQCRAACHYTNLQPLWAADNLKKGGRE